MARPKTTSVNKIVRRRADGTISHVDFYHRTSRLHLGRDEAEAHRKAAEMEGAHPPGPPSVRIFDGLCASYLASEGFLKLAPKSRKLNRLYVSKLLRRFGGVEVEGVTRVVVIAFRERLSKEIRAAALLPKPEKKQNFLSGQEGPMTPTVAKNLVNKLAILLKHALNLGVIKGESPAASPKAGFGVRARSKEWSDQQLARFFDAADPAMKLAAALFFYTAQRPDDAMSMAWSQVDVRVDESAWITLVQAKTGEMITFPAHRDLAAILIDAQVGVEKSGLILASPGSKVKWAYRNFARAWDKVVLRADYRLARKMFSDGATKAEIRPHLLGTLGLQRRDLRRTAMVRMASAGATDLQIAAVSGHTVEQTRRILDTYIPRRGVVAAGAISAWERLPTHSLRPVALPNPLHNVRNSATGVFE